MVIHSQWIYDSTKNRYGLSRTHLRHPLSPKGQIQCFKVPGCVNLDIFVSLFISRLEGGPKATHSRLLSMNEDLFGRMQSVLNNNQ